MLMAKGTIRAGRGGIDHRAVVRYQAYLQYQRTVFKQFHMFAALLTGVSRAYAIDSVMMISPQLRFSPELADWMHYNGVWHG